MQKTRPLMTRSIPNEMNVEKHHRSTDLKPADLLQTSFCHAATCLFRKRRARSGYLDLSKPMEDSTWASPKLGPCKSKSWTKGGASKFQDLI